MAQSTKKYPHGHKVTFARGAVMADAESATESLKRIQERFGSVKKLREIYGNKQGELRQAIKFLRPLCKEPTESRSPDSSD